MKELFEVARNRNLALLLSGRIVSVGGDFVYQIALSVAIFGFSHHNTLSVSIFWLVRLLPGVVLGAFAGSLADRYGFRKSMIVADLGRMVLVALMALLAHGSTWIALYPLIFLVSCFSSLFNPANVGLVPSLVESREQRLAANVVMGEIASIASIVGSVLGGILAAAGLTVVLLLADAITFGISAFSLSLIRVKDRVQETVDDDEADSNAGWLAGFRLLTRRPLLLFAISVMAVPEFGSGAVIVWIVPYAEEALNLSSAWVGYLSAAMGIGAVLGGFAAAAIGGNVRLDTLLVIGVAILGVALTVFGAVHVAVAAIVCLVIVGLAETLEYAAYETLIQQAVPETMIGRVAGSIDTIFVNLMLAGNVLSGILAATIGLTFSIVAIGILTVAMVVIAWLNLRRQTAGQPDARTLERVPAFAAVSNSVREWAVRRMVRQQFAPGTVVIMRGDVGDTFYTISGGRAEVEVETEGGSVKRELGPGDFFGEIALLRNVPRTATVRALDPLTVYAMSREDFEELQDRASEFKRSLLETATARTEEDRNVQLTFASRMG